MGRLAPVQGLGSQPVIDPIRVRGLVEFQRSLKEMDQGAQKQLRVVFNRAADIVVADASPSVPQRTGAAARSIRARSGQREAVIVAGGRKALHYPWIDFGGRVGIHKSVERKFIKSGRYLYPSYSANVPKIQTLLSDGLRELATSAGLEVR